MGLVSLLLFGAAQAADVSWALINYTYEWGTQSPALQSPHVSSSLSSLAGLEPAGELGNNGIVADDSGANHFLALNKAWQFYAQYHRITFEIKVEPGYELNLASMGWDTYAGYNIYTAGNGALHMAAYSADIPFGGYPGWSQDGGTNLDITSNWGYDPKVTQFYWLSGVSSLQHLTGTKHIVLTPWMDPQSASSWGAWWGIDNVFFHGNVVALPIPATLTITDLKDGNVRITSSLAGGLESTTDIAGISTVWASEGPISGSITNPATGTAKFYRVVRVIP